MQPVKKVESYIKGKASDLVVCSLAGKWVEIDTAIAFLLMSRAAFESGIVLRISSGFRSMATQRRLWKERSDPEVRKLKGGAARPGYSNHQSGLAIDIRTGLTRTSFMKGKRSPVYDWLEENAGKYGFARTVKNEPWHWERVYTPERIDV